MGVIRNPDTTGLGETLNTRRNVHPITKQVAASNSDISHVNSDPKAERLLLAHPSVRFPELFLDGCGALDRIYDARELGQDAIASRVGNPAAVLGDKAVHYG